MRTLALIALLAACGGNKKNDRPRADAAAKQDVDTATATGAIRGSVAYAGEAKRQEVVFNEAACKGPAYDELVKVSGGKLENAFVWVKSGLEGWRFPPASGEVTIDQKNCLYVPTVVGVRVGQPLAFLNSDPVTHNVHTLPVENDSANFAMDRVTTKVVKTFDTEEVMVKTKCDVHPWMKAWIGVVDHPHFAVTGADGGFEFKGLPPGDYEVEVWHESLGRKSQKVTVAQGGTADVELSF